METLKNKLWREGNLIAVDDFQNKENTGAFLLVSEEPCYQDPSTGKFIYFALAENKDEYRVYRVPVGLDGTQDGFCSPYVAITGDRPMKLVEEWDWAVKEFYEVFRECSEEYKALYS